MKRYRSWLPISAILGLSLALAACGGAGKTTDSSTGSTDPAVVAKADAAVKAARAGTFRTPPSDGPVAQTGKEVWAIACTAAVPGCQFPVESVAEAGKELGWNVRLVDGKGDPTAYNAAIRQAVVSGADGIILDAIDCSLVRNALEFAKEKTVPVVGIYAFDCDDPAVGGNKSYFAQGDKFYGGTAGDYFFQQGVLKGQQIVSETNGDAKVVYATMHGHVTAGYIEKGLMSVLDKCSGCEVVERVVGTSAELANGAVSQRIETAFQQHPNANVLSYWTESRLLATVQTVKKLKAQNPKLVVFGGEGAPGVEQLLSEGISEGSVGIPLDWLGWAGADALNRVFAGKDIPDEGLGFQIIDGETQFQPNGTWDLPVDFKKAYKDVWTGQ